MTANPCYPVVITDRGVVALAPRPGATLRVTEVGIAALLEALEGPRTIELTDYTSWRLEAEHGVKVPPSDPSDPVDHQLFYIASCREIAVDASSPTAPLRFYLTEIRYPPCRRRARSKVLRRQTRIQRLGYDPEAASKKQLNLWKE